MILKRIKIMLLGGLVTIIEFKVKYMKRFSDYYMKLETSTCTIYAKRNKSIRVPKKMRCHCHSAPELR